MMAPKAPFLVRALKTPYRALPRLRGVRFWQRRLAGLAVGTVHTKVRGGGTMLLDLQDELQWETYLRGVWERPEAELLERLIRPGAVVHDVGANIGFHSLRAAQLAGPAGRVVAFEPVAANRARLEEHVRLNALSNVTVVPCALSDAQGDVSLSVPRGAGAHASLLPRTGEATEIAPAARLDDLVQSGRFPPPDIIKIDVEGAEAKVLRGAFRTLAEKPDVAVLVEITPPYLQRLGDSEAGLRSLLADAGFRPGSIVSRIPCQRDGVSFDQTNELFLKGAW